MNTSPWIEAKYTDIIIGQLKLGEKVNANTWNCRCPICGDSQKDEYKKRGYIINNSGDFSYYCHNCNASMSLSEFIKDLFPMYYTDFRKEKFLESSHTPAKTPDIAPSKLKQSLFTNVKKKDTGTHNVRVSPVGTNYLTTRQVPESKWKYFVHTWDYRDLLKKHNYIDYEKLPDKPAMVIPLIINGKLVGFQARMYKPVNGMRYFTNRFDENVFFYPYDIKPEETVYVTEGVYDSVMLENCIASLNSNLARLKNHFEQMVFVHDNEPHNEHIVRQMKRSVETKKCVFIPDNRMVEKDLNDMVVKGVMTIDELQEYVKERTFKHPMSLMRFNEWKKV